MAGQNQNTAAPEAKGGYTTPSLSNLGRRNATKTDVSNVQSKLQKRPPAKNLFEWITQRAQEVDAYFIKPFQKELDNFFLDDLPTVIEKATVAGAPRKFSPASATAVKKAAEDSFKAVTGLAMTCYTGLKGTLDGMKTDKKAHAMYDSAVTNGLALIEAAKETLDAEQLTWRQYVADFAQASKLTLEQAVRFIAEQNKQHIQYGYG